jgi:hypothetical protein
VYDRATPAAPLDAMRLDTALGRARPALPGGSRLSMEPGGQVEVKIGRAHV